MFVEMAAPPLLASASKLPNWVIFDDGQRYLINGEANVVESTLPYWDVWRAGRLAIFVAARANLRAAYNIIGLSAPASTNSMQR
jgi:hypothetical protein